MKKNQVKKTTVMSLVTVLISAVGFALTLEASDSPVARAFIRARIAEVTGPNPMTFGMRVGPPGGALPPQRIVDQFGQYTQAQWPEKISAATDLTARRDEEQSKLMSHTQKSPSDEYGGWAGGPGQQASGYFRTAKVQGKWWLVTPTGHLFFSVGMNETGRNTATFVTNREEMFTWLPTTGDPLASHYGTAQALKGPIKEGRTFDFFSANLERKYGQSWKGKWEATTQKRLKDWGFNTIGNWSEAAFRRVGIPYVVGVNTNGNFNHVSSGSDFWAPMPDPFDPGFAAAFSQNLQKQHVSPQDPRCIGYFVDNEMSWGGRGGHDPYGLTWGALAQEADRSPAKRALISQLRAKYITIGRMNGAWGTNVASWEALEQPLARSEAPTAPAKDLAAFLSLFATQYFQTVQAVLHTQDPHHLYLGSRFDRQPPAVVLEAATRYCDVVSFNVYQKSLNTKPWRFLSTLDKPTIIGEFHFGARDHGLFSAGMVDAGGQEQRAVLYKQYVQSALDNPAVVGCHWFQYVDEPLTGRTLDGENFGIGFVDVTDTPYEALVVAAREANASIYAHRVAGDHGPAPVP